LLESEIFHSILKSGCLVAKRTCSVFLKPVFNIFFLKCMTTSQRIRLLH
jgi:hypothetical protein